jgi:hypothetical protein
MLTDTRVRRLFWNPASALGPETNAWNLGGF